MFSNSKKLKTFNVKKDERAISRKRKLEAFLNLVRKEDEDAASMPKKKTGNFQETYKTLKDELKQYQKKEVADPLFYLTDDGQSALIKFSSNTRSLASTSPLFIEDIYHLLLKSIFGNLSPFPLNWAKLERPQNVSKTVVIEIDGVSEEHIFKMNSELNQKFNIFRYIFEVISSSKHFATELSTMHMVENFSSGTQGKSFAFYPMKKGSSQNMNEKELKMEKCVKVGEINNRSDKKIEDIVSTMNKPTVKGKLCKLSDYSEKKICVKDDEIINSSKKIEDTVSTTDESTIKKKGKHYKLSKDCERKICVEGEEIIKSSVKTEGTVSTTDESTIKKKGKHYKFSKSNEKIAISVKDGEIIDNSAKKIEDTISASDEIAGKLKNKHNVCKEEEKMETCVQDGEMIDSCSEIREDAVSTSEKIINRNYKVSKLHLLLSPIQLAMERFPLPQNVFGPSKSHGFKFTKESYTPVTENSPMFAVDCEMCITTNHENELTRVAVVNEDLETVYETLVKPKAKITNYLTKYSGITREMLVNVTTTIEDVQRDIRNFLPSDAILVGQSLNSDLNALKLMHPYVIDTSVIFNNNGVRKKKVSLKKLVLAHLNEVIQDHNKIGHHPVEDSIGAMKLVLFKLQKTLWYGDQVLLNSIPESIPSTTDDSIENKKSTHYKYSENGEKIEILVENKQVNYNSAEKEDSISASDETVKKKGTNHSGNKKESSIDKSKNGSKNNENLKVPEYIQLDTGPEYWGFFERITKFFKKACLVGNEDALSNYRLENPSEFINKVIESSNKEIVKAISSNLSSNNLIISHLQLHPELEMLDEINECIKEVFDNLPQNALFILLAGKKVDVHFKHRICMTVLKDTKNKL